MPDSSEAIGISTSGPGSDRQLTPRQQRELAYHREFVAKNKHKIEAPVAFDVIGDRRQWWNAYWETYHLLKESGLTGKKILVPGCGFGDDAIRLATLGAEVYAFDLSDDLVAVAGERAKRNGVAIHTAVMPCETMTYEDDFFDGIVFVDILHHVDIARTMQEVRRVLKPGAFIIGDELFTHSWLQRVRESRFVDKFLYPRMVKFIYGTDRPYITADEHKIDERELAVVLAAMSKETVCLPFMLLSGRLFPSHFARVAKFDQIVLRAVGAIGRRLCGRMVFTGRIAAA